MALTSLVITGDWEKYKKFLSPGHVDRHLKREIRKATIKNAFFLVRKIKNKIRGKKLTANSPLTIALKKGKTPLLDEGNLMRAIGKEIVSSFEAVVGIVGKNQTTGGVSGKSIDMETAVLLLHEGYTIDVTPQMRAAIAIALREKGSREAKSALSAMNDASGSGKDIWRVPPRRFLTSVFKNLAVQRVIKRNWSIAIETGLKRAAQTKVSIK